MAAGCCLSRLPGERIDIWLVRYNGMGPANYWGFKQLRYRELEEVVGASQGERPLFAFFRQVPCSPSGSETPVPGPRQQPRLSCRRC